MVWKRVPSPKKGDLAAFLREHKRRARFLVDESLGIEVARQIRELGYNVKYVEEVGLTGHSDEDIYTFAYKDNRIILTHDDDFLNNVRFPPSVSPGVVIIPGGSGDENSLAKAVAQVLHMFGPLGDFFQASKISISSEGIWTVSKFERKTGRIEKSIYKFPKHGNAMEWVE
jgi:predicted nuclease of predicted toxin-antitoxin system